MKNDPYAPEFESDQLEEMLPEQEARIIPRWLSALVAMIAVSGFVSLAWYAYRAGSHANTNEGELMLVEADKTPMKEKPLDPGGMQFPNQDKTVFNTLSGPEKSQAERVVPVTEEPAKRPENAPNWVNEKLRKGSESASASNTGKEMLIDNAANANKLAPSSGKENTIKLADAASGTTPGVPTGATMPMPPVDTAPAAAVVATPTPAPTPAAAAVSEHKPAEVPLTPPASAAVSVKDAPKEIAKDAPSDMDSILPPPVKIVKSSKSKTAKAASAPASTPKTVALKTKKKTNSVTAAHSAPAAAATSSHGGSTVQLGAYRSEGEAQSAWSKMQRKYASQLGGHSPSIEKAELGAKGTYYRLRLAVNDAKGTCSALTAAHQACIVVR